MNVWELAMQVTWVEERAPKLKQVLASGSMLKGYRARESADVDPEQVERTLAALESEVATLLPRPREGGLPNNEGERT